MNEKKQVVSMSGGKDSTAMALMMIDNGEQIEEFIFVDTGVEFPECYKAIDRFEQITGRKVTRLKAPFTFEWFAYQKPIKWRNGVSTKKDGSPKRAKGYGWPNIFRRWCTKNLKLKVIEKYKKEHYPNGCIDCIGIASDEQKRIKDNPNKRYPLVELGVTENDCMVYCKERGFYPSPCAYDYIDRMSCFLCPLQNNKGIQYLINHRPELWQRIKELEAKIGEPWRNVTNQSTEYFENRFKNN